MFPALAAGDSAPRTGGHGWSADATAYESRVGSIYRYYCPPDGTVNDI